MIDPIDPRRGRAAARSSAANAELGRAVRAIAEVFAAEGTDPMVDWSIPAVHLLHPLARATIAPYVLCSGAGSGVAITRPMWIVDDAAERVAVADVVARSTGVDGITFAEERSDDGTWAALAYRVVERAAHADWGTGLAEAHRGLETAVMAAMADAARAVRARLDRIASPRSRLLRHAFALLRDDASDPTGVGEEAAVSAVTRKHVTLRWGAEGLPVFLTFASAERLDALTLVAGHDGRWSRDEIAALGQVFAIRAIGRSGLQVVDVPGDLGVALGVVSQLPASVATDRLREALEAHLDLARDVAGVPVGARVRA